MVVFVLILNFWFSSTLFKCFLVSSSNLLFHFLEFHCCSKNKFYLMLYPVLGKCLWKSISLVNLHYVNRYPENICFLSMCITNVPIIRFEGMLGVWRNFSYLALTIPPNLVIVSAVVPQSLGFYILLSFLHSACVHNIF